MNDKSDCNFHSQMILKISTLPKFHGLLKFLLMMLFIQSSFAKVFNTNDGVLLDYIVVGNGEPLVLLHSGLMSRDDMQKQIDYFSKKYQVIALDSREHGRSSASVNQISYQLMSNDVIALLDHLHIEKAHIFGQSDGGITGLITAFYYPERIRRLVIQGAVYHYSAYSDEAINSLKSITWDRHNPQDLDQRKFPGMGINSYLLNHDDLSTYQEYLQEMAKMWSTTPLLTLEQVKSIKVPILVIVGDHFDVSIEHSVKLHKALKNSQLFVVPGATHYVHHEKPQLLQQVIADFLSL